MATRRTLIAGAAAALLAPPTRATGQAFESRAVERGRATVPVLLNGEGPFRFAVDTAANCSVVTTDLVARLALPVLGELAMHTLVGREVAPAVRVNRVRSGALDATSARFAVGRREAMAGLDGLLGTDLLAESRLVLNFRGRERIRIARSRAPARGFLDTGAFQGNPPVVGERRFGSLMAIPVRVGQAGATAVIDSGAEGTVLNRAAARAGRAIALTGPDGQTTRRIQSPTGETTSGEAMLLRELDIAGATVTNLPVAVGDFHTFAVWGLESAPALLVGLDVFRLFAAVHIDLKRNEFSVRL